MGKREYDESDVRVRPGKRSRPRTKTRPAHEDAQTAMVVSVDRGRWGCALDGDPERIVVAMRARELGRTPIVVGDVSRAAAMTVEWAKYAQSLSDKPVKGMVILWGIRKDGDTWDGGQILDPVSGKVYSVKITPTDGDKKLDVRGFMGFSLIGRTQTWMRQE